MAWLQSAKQVPLTPANSFILALLFIVLLETLVLNAKLQQPWTGIQLKATNDSLVVTAVAANSPLAGRIKPGEHLRSLDTPNDSIPLPRLLRVLPLSIPTYHDLDALLDLQARLHTAFLSNATLTLTTDTGRRLAFTPHQRTRLQDIPAVFWWILLANITALLLGVIVWVCKPYTLEASCLLLASVSHYVAESVFRLSASQEFYLPPQWTSVFAGLEGGSFYLFMASLFLILCYYPNRAAPHWLLLLAPVVTVLLALNYCLRWWEIPIHIYILPIFPIIFYSTWLFYKQWVLSIGNPVSRATVLLLQLSALLPAWLIILTHAIPVMLGDVPLLGDVATRIFLVGIFAGWAVGILRFRLFDIEYWWLKSLLWIAGGSLLVALDVVLVTVFQASAPYALGTSVILSGFLYLPLRQWLLDKIMPLERRSLQDYLPVFSASMAKATSQKSFEQHWEKFLLQHFAPLHLEAWDEQRETSNLSDDGLHLYVPSLGNRHSFRLSGKQQASRLFNQSDVKNTESLLTVARMAINASETRQRAVLEERQRIMSDLHDSVGAQLMTLMHKLPDPEHKQAARLTLMALRDTIRLSQKTCPLKLVDHVADWRTEIAERTEAAGVELVWQQGDLDSYLLNAKQVLELTQVIREAVSNALKHAQPEVLEIGVSVKDGKLHVCIMNDGRVSLPSTWRAGTGLNTMKKRMHGVNGDIQFRLATLPTTKMQVLLSLPLLKQSGPH
ncbi:hypothetical protein VSS37_09160 [Candidatus Thiothrix sp. Deng01]|uniref:Histidine kinase/HSP90-like ATPase domain-containing protein n=1 Tax=Candidatus Thiothrix phosphatis TaxID=3112415 RepID=A0ABU6CWE6_9GAMM|nr:hypothetical protein [Candidatus Thiothrix sp. Deng01]MEB4591144.1 hypothetical protein [Candidatus Thiothrix sp. Deng01]